MINIVKNLVVGSVLLTSATLFSQESTITQQQLPRTITKYITTHYPGKKLSQISQEKKLRKTEYEIHLENGTKLEFDNTTISEIESNEKLPSAVVPKNILAYVVKNYPQNYITEWKSSYTKQEVELNSGVELEFDKKGEFLRIDR